MPNKLEHDSFLDMDTIGYDVEHSDLDGSTPMFSEGLDLEGQVEAIIFASPKPMKINDIFDVLKKSEVEVPMKDLERALKALVRSYQERGGGFALVYLKKLGYQFQTVKAAGKLMENLFASRPRPLSRAALETLAVVAYRQPVTRADIEFIRGVDSGSILKNLLDREIVACVGRKEDAGRPMIFGTTQEFLRIFGLDSLEALPPLSSFQPSSELIKGAKEKLDSIDQDIDISEIVEGDTRGELVSDSLLEDLEKTDHNLDNPGPEGKFEVEGAELNREALFEAKDEGVDDFEGNTDDEATKIFGRERPVLKKGSRSMDS